MTYPKKKKKNGWARAKRQGERERERDEIAEIASGFRMWHDRAENDFPFLFIDSDTLLSWKDNCLGWS